VPVDTAVSEDDDAGTADVVEVATDEATDAAALVAELRVDAAGELLDEQPLMASPATARTAVTRSAVRRRAVTRPAGSLLDATLLDATLPGVARPAGSRRENFTRLLREFRR
jgi:hypothetical protein